MKKIKLRFSVVFLLFLILGFSSVQAYTINDNCINTKFKCFNEYKTHNPNSKRIVSDEKYIKITYDKYLKKNIIQEFNKNNYLKELNKEKRYNNVRSWLTTQREREYGWIKLKIEVYKDTNTNYSVFGFYEWLKSPFFEPYDIVCLSHGSGVTFNYTKSQLEYYDHGGDLYRLYNCNSSNFVEDIGGVAFKTEGGDSIAVECKPFGVIHTVMHRTSRSCELKLSYAHSQIGVSVNPNISIPLNAGLSINAYKQYDKVDLCHQVEF